MSRLKFWSSCLIGLLAGVLSQTSLAQTSATTAQYPDKPVRLIITVPPGGASDFVARLAQLFWSKIKPERTARLPVRSSRARPQMATLCSSLGFRLTESALTFTILYLMHHSKIWSRSVPLLNFPLSWLSTLNCPFSLSKN